MSTNPTPTSAWAPVPEATNILIERLEDAVYEWSNYVVADDAPRTLTKHVDPHIKALERELQRLSTLKYTQADLDAASNARKSTTQTNAVLAEVRDYLTCVIDKSMSRNNAESLAAELLEQLHGLEGEKA